MNPVRLRGLIAPAHAVPPLVGGANWSRHQATSAIRADILQDCVNAVCTERAFVAADPGILGICRQILVTAFAVGTKSEHSEHLSGVHDSCRIEEVLH